jgi:hypothetical protein
MTVGRAVSPITDKIRSECDSPAKAVMCPSNSGIDHISVNSGPGCREVVCGIERKPPLIYSVKTPRSVG